MPDLVIYVSDCMSNVISESLKVTQTFILFESLIACYWLLDIHPAANATILKFVLYHHYDLLVLLLA